MGIKVPKSSVKNPFQLYLNANQESVMNVSLVYSDGAVRNNIYDPMTDQQLQYIKEAIQQSNAIDGSVYYFNVNVIDNTKTLIILKNSIINRFKLMKQIYNTLKSSINF